MNLYISPSDITTVTINIEIFSQDSDFDYSASTSALQTDVQVDIQPYQPRYVETDTGGTVHSTHMMYSASYNLVRLAQLDGDVSVTDGTNTYDIRSIKDYTSHMESELEERR
jgi:hypothetical protein